VPESLRAAVRRYWLDFESAISASEAAAAAFDTALLMELCRVWASSEFVAQRCVSRPELLLDLVASGDLHRRYLPADDSTSAPGDVATHLQQALQEVTDADALGGCLRRLRQREMVRIAWRDLANLADLNETMADLSALADACIQGAMGWLQTSLISVLGEPLDASGEPQGMLVLGMGKLGAGELNFSSDVDLIFAYPDEGETTKGKVNSMFFTQLGQQLIRALDETTSEGFVFRVDMRLRPFGQSGALVSSFAGLEHYYQSHGRDWERYAFIKARVVAGDREAGETLFDILRPFVFRRYLDYGAFESLRDMKQMVESELKRKGMIDNVKLGAGGIREVEFIGQAFQLVRGGREPALQRREIQTVLNWLGEHDYLPEYAVQQLLTAYEFLRNTEHRLQEFQDQQTHRLPSDALGRQRLAFSMGFAYWDEFLPTLRGHMTRVHSHFEQVFASPQAGHAAVDDSGLSRLWLEEPNVAEASTILQAAGYHDAGALYSRLRVLKTGRCYDALSRTGRTRMDRLIPLLLGVVSKHESEAVARDTTLLRVLSLLETIASRTAYLSLLGEQPMVLSQLVRLCAASPWITQLLARHPILLDELLDPRSLYAPPKRSQLEADLQRRLSRFDEDDLEQAMDALRLFKQASVLRVAAADVVKAVPLMEVSNHLTDIAEVVLQAALELAWRHLVERHGRPSCVVSTQSAISGNMGFAIIAYGKLGGLELGYASDLDLVFLHADSGSSGSAADAVTDGAKPIADTVFYARLGQRIIHILTVLTPAGVLYETDMRLRPSGASGLLVTGLESFAAYQRQQAWTWEHQALVRARMVAGDERLRIEFEALRREVLMLPRETEALRKDIAEMRERMRETRGDRQAGQFDLKQGRGGIADIEFMVQFGVLNWAHKTPALTDYTDNIRLLESFPQQLAEPDFLSAQDALFLADTYRCYRVEVHRLALQDQKAVVADDQFVAERRRVTQLWQAVMAKH
jgi:glutamate-ammonia-ligase adenylyltransferase